MTESPQSPSSPTWLHRILGRIVGLGLTALVILMLVAGFVWVQKILGTDPVDRRDHWREGRLRMASLGQGFLVWESSRSGTWRIYRQELDGSGLRRISPQEPGHDHFAPHLSPDGSRLVYLSYPTGSSGYQPVAKGIKVAMHLLAADGSEDRVLLEDARAYWGNRAAVWRSASELHCIDAQGHGLYLDLHTMEPRRLTEEGDEEYGWLVNAQATYATKGNPSFSPFDASRGSIAQRRMMAGCQPYFSGDGIWGYWNAGLGGPIQRFELASGDIDTILAQDDPRLPSRRNYAYFAMLSRCQRLMAFAASPDQHDAFSSDYDLFLAQTDPETLMIQGEPVRYTFHRRCDRYPDVFLAGQELGRHRGEAPLSIALADPRSGIYSSGAWLWDYGDGTVPAIGNGQHRYAEPGTYGVMASRGSQRLGAEVVVLPPAPPELRRVDWNSQLKVLVTFNEPVQLQGASAQLLSGLPVQGVSSLSSGGSHSSNLLVELAMPLEQADTLILRNISDCAQQPNRLSEARVELRPPVWPVNPELLLYAFSTANGQDMVLDPDTGVQRTYTLQRQGRAHLNQDHAMVLRQGACRVQGLDDKLQAACKQSNEWSLEAVIRPTAAAEQAASIISGSRGQKFRNFRLLQEGEHLYLQLRTRKTGGTGCRPPLQLCKLQPGKTQHVLVTYRPGQVSCYYNGEPVLQSAKVKGSFANWSALPLIFGDEEGGGADWDGVLEGVALYGRCLDVKEARRNADASMKRIRARAPRLALQVRATLRQCSKAPTLQEISPYREALMVLEYEDDKGKLWRVAHWAILDGKVQAEAQWQVGDEVSLRLEPFAENVQLQSTYCADSLAENFDLPLWFQVEG